MVFREMIDTTHAGLAAALPAIKAMPPGSIVGLYDTGSPDILATAADLKTIPSVDHVILIDQGFTGSPNLAANVRDCENGAWSVSQAVNTKGWTVPRPTLYLGFPDTAQEAFNAGWRKDIWTVLASTKAPTAPPTVPAGLNVVAQQWDFSHPAYDRSVVFDSNWPEVAKVATPNPPVGQWKDPKEWEWKHVICTGVGLNGEQYVTTFDPVTGTWSHPVKVA